LGKLIAIGLDDHHRIFGKLQPIRAHSHTKVRRCCNEGLGHLGLEPNLPDCRNIRRGKLARRAAPEGTQSRFRNGIDALNQVCILWSARDEFTIFLAIRRVFRPKLVNLLAQVLNTLGCCKHRRTLLGATWNRKIFDAEKHKATGV